MGKGWAKGNYCDLIPDVLFGVNFSNCCYNHDVDYWQKPITRKAADLRLIQCMNTKCKLEGKVWMTKWITPLIYFFLRIGGWIKW